MKGFNLFFAVVCTALLSVSFVSCSDDNTDTPPTPEKKPGVTVTAGTATDTTLSFTITPENAQQCAWICIEAGEVMPSAEEILSTQGTSVSAAEATTVDAVDLTPETEYIIVAAASDGTTTVLSEQLAMTTLEKAAIEMQTATAEVYTGNANITFAEPTGTYQLALDFYYDREAKWLPEGTYTIVGSGYAAGTVNNNVQYTYFTLRKEDKTLKINEGTVTVAIVDEKFDIKAELSTDNGAYTVVYKGDIEGIKFSYDFVATAAKRIEVNDEKPGEYYLKLNDNNWGYELVLDLFADPTSSMLPEGTYTVGTDETPGTVGPKSCIDIYSPNSSERFATGTVDVKKEGNTYTLGIKVANAEGYKINGTFTGEIADMVRAVPAIEMQAAIAGVYTGNAAITFTEPTETYQLALDFYYDREAKWLPEGTYPIGSGYAAGTVNNDIQYSYFWLRKEETNLKINEGTVTVAIVDDKYDIKAEFSTDNGAYTVVYKGDIEGIKFSYDFVATAAKRMEIRDEKAGEYYLKLNDNSWGYELTLDLFADPTSTTLPEGAYTVGTDETPGTVGPKSCIDIYSPNSSERFATGTVNVKKEGDIYTLDIKVANAEGYKINGTFTGAITDMVR